MRRVFAMLGLLLTAATAIGQQNVVAANGQTYATGWVQDKAATQRLLNRLQRQGKPQTFEQAAPKLLRVGAGDDAVFYWNSEQRVLGKTLPSWDQKRVGSCVGFGYGRAVQDLLLNEVSSGQPEVWPGSEQCPEVIYAGSRVEIGGGGINGDGSIGAWAAEFVKEYGTVKRDKYGNLDLTVYNEAACRRMGDTGLPADLEKIAKMHPVKEIALITSADGLWAAIGTGKGVPICSMLGFTTARDADGYCRQTGQWAHCMEVRGRFVHPTRGRSVVIQNSWGDYLGSSNAKVKYRTADGSVKEEALPQGCFAVELNVAARGLAERDTFALAGLAGWEAPTPPPPPPPPPPPVPGEVVSITVGGMTVVIDFKNKKVTVPANWLIGSPAPTPTKAKELTIADQLTAELNAVRARYGLAPLVNNPALNGVCERSVGLMARVGRVFHSGDHVAAGGQRSVREVIQDWMNSPGHRAWLLSPGSRSVGWGHATGAGYGTFWAGAFSSETVTTTETTTKTETTQTETTTQGCYMDAGGRMVCPTNNQFQPVRQGPLQRIFGRR